MKYADKLHNMLIHSNLLPPPVTSGRKYNKHSHWLNHNTLLHQAYAFCGRVSVCLLLMLPFVCVSCEKPDLDDYTDPTTRSGEEQNDSTGSVTTILVGTDWDGEKTFTF